MGKLTYVQREIGCWPPNPTTTQGLTVVGAAIARGAASVSGHLPLNSLVMNAALYFELVDAVAKTAGPAELITVAERISATPMHPLERRVLERALRARTEALAIQSQIGHPGLYRGAGSEPSSIVAGG